MPTASPHTWRQGEGCLFKPEPAQRQGVPEPHLQETNLKLSCLWRAGFPGEESKSCAHKLVRKPEEASRPSGRRTAEKASIPWPLRLVEQALASTLTAGPQHSTHRGPASAGALMTAASFLSATVTVALYRAPLEQTLGKPRATYPSQGEDRMATPSLGHTSLGAP